MKLIDQIVLDVGDIKSCKQIRPFDVKYLGYKFSKNRIQIKETGYIICEIVEEVKLKPVSFCLLLSSRSMMGIILAFPFSKYQEIVNIEKKTRAKKPKSPSRKIRRRPGRD